MKTEPMILVVHKQAKTVLKVLKDNEEIDFQGNKLVDLFWSLAEEHPHHVIAWCDTQIQENLNIQNWSEIFHHNLIMASFATKTSFFSEHVGYIDQLPYIKVNREVKYPTWQMSSDVGGIFGKTLLRFKNLFSREQNFQLLINSIAKLGQQNGLFTYSVPTLIVSKPKAPVPKASTEELFGFVFSHYKTIRLFILFWCFIKFEKSFPFYALIRAFFRKKYFRIQLDISAMEIESSEVLQKNPSIDVIIPTFGRRRFLLQVMEDLKRQTSLPERVIVVEQSLGPETDLPELQMENWPFKVIHHFTNKTGACRARNIALNEVKADLVFFADDDIRFDQNLLENSVKELIRLKVQCLNINCKQKGEQTVFKKIKQWGSFGSGTSIVDAEFCKNIRFDTVFEFGFGEDQDYGMQLRNIGCDIIYHPVLEIVHLKAPRGGFRKIKVQPWEKDEPKPSPTMMCFIKKHYTKEQTAGYKTELFLRFYLNQEIKNPIKYSKNLKKRWKKSEEWADKIIEGNSSLKFSIS